VESIQARISEKSYFLMSHGNSAAWLQKLQMAKVNMNVKVWHSGEWSEH
jgi:hypothetical protein